MSQNTNVSNGKCRCQAGGLGKFHGSHFGHLNLFRISDFDIRILSRVCLKIENDHLGTNPLPQLKRKVEFVLLVGTVNVFFRQLPCFEREFWEEGIACNLGLD